MAHCPTIPVPRQTRPFCKIRTVVVLLVPADIAVDANRDGVIDNKDRGKTTQDKPYRFWCNWDNDSGEKDNPGSSTKDSASNTIVSLRDLEDYTRLYLNIGGLQDAIANDDIQVGLSWRNVTGSPEIKVFQAAEADGGDQYLKDDVAAGNQKTGTFGTALGTVSSGGSFKLPLTFWKSNLLGLPQLDADHPNRYLLFEGVTEGKGQLVLTFWKGTTPLGEGGSVWLDLKDIKKMYQSSEEDVFEKPQDETQQSIVFVHGWNMSPKGSRSFAETMFKRLWHRGFKGRFAYFRWNTDWSDAFDNVPGVGEAAEAYFANYNKSEYEAWLHGGPQLKAFVEQVPGTKNIAGHSMGNIVVGSALAGGMKVSNYAMLQAAVAASCYDDRAIIQQTQPVSHAVSLNFWGIPVPLPTSITVWNQASPDGDADPATQALAYRGMLKDIAQNCNPISFYLPNDNATSYAWEINNGVTKPPGAWANQYRYIPSNPSGQRLFKDYGGGVVDYTWSSRFESMAFAASSWGKAVGAEPRTDGAIPAASGVNLGDAQYQLPSESAGAGFGTQHCGEFNANIQELKPFYNTLLDKFVIPRNP